MRRKPLLLILVPLLGLGGFLLWQRLAGHPIATVKPSRGPAVEAAYATGTLEPLRWSKIATTQPGRIVALLAKEGERVEEGTPLAKLDDRDARANLAQLYAKEKFLREDLDRQSILAAKSIASRQTQEKAKSELDQTRAAIDSAKKSLSDRTLYSPLAGMILKREGEVGEMADSGKMLFWIGEPTPLRVVAEVDERDIPQVAPGQKALVKADAFPDTTFAGTVTEQTPLGDSIAKTFRVYIRLPDDVPLRSGMTVEVNIVTREIKDALLVPSSAVRKGMVWIVADGRAQRRAVKTGASGENRIEIRDGLTGGEDVIVEPSPDLKEGTRLRPKG